jgi:hypothetical protein
MPRLEDGIFTQAYTTVAAIDATYKLYNGTHKLLKEEAAAIGEKLIKLPDEDMFTMQETHELELNSPALSAGVQVISDPENVGKAKRVYTNGVGSTNGKAVTFKLLDDTTVTITVYAGTWLPIATKGCDTAGLLVIA